jgi:hypothetical protein
MAMIMRTLLGFRVRIARHRSRIRSLAREPIPPPASWAAVIDRTVQLVDSGALRMPEGQSITVEKFSDAVYLAESPEHGGKPLLVFEPQ